MVGGVGPRYAIHRFPIKGGITMMDTLREMLEGQAARESARTLSFWQRLLNVKGGPIIVGVDLSAEGRAWTTQT
jgi:hypothetical protein